MTVNELIDELRRCRRHGRHESRAYGNIPVQFDLPDGVDLTYTESLPIGKVGINGDSISLTV